MLDEAEDGLIPRLLNCSKSVVKTFTVKPARFGGWHNQTIREHKVPSPSLITKPKLFTRLIKTYVDVVALVAIFARHLMMYGHSAMIGLSVSRTLERSLPQ